MKLERDEVVTLFSGVVGHVFGAVVVVVLTLATVYFGSGVIGAENTTQSNSLLVAGQTVQEPSQDKTPKQASVGNGSGEQPGGQAAGASVERAYQEDYEETAEGYYDD